MFVEKKIESLCTRDMTFLLGQQLQLLHAVENLQVEEAETPEAFYINAEVGSKAGGGETVYPVWIRCRRQTGEIEDFSCECAAFQDEPGMCRHCVAAALAYLEQKKSAERMKLYRGLLAFGQRDAAGYGGICDASSDAEAKAGRDDRADSKAVRDRTELLLWKKELRADLSDSGKQRQELCAAQSE